MAEDTREELRRRLADARERGGSVCLTHAHTAAVLARLDAADPLRQRVRSIVRSAMSETSQDPEVVARTAWNALREIDRATTPEGGEQP